VSLACLVKVDYSEPVGLALAHVAHTEQEPLCVFVGVQVKSQVELIVPTPTVRTSGYTQL